MSRWPRHIDRRSQARRGAGHQRRHLVCRFKSNPIPRSLFAGSDHKNRRSFLGHKISRGLTLITTAAGNSKQLLTGALTRVASDPARVAELYEIFRAYCHQYRNTLNSLKMCLYLARKWGEPGLWQDMERHYNDVEMVMDRFQLLWRPMILHRVTLPINLLIDDRKTTWSEALASTGRHLILVAPDSTIQCSFDPLRLAQAFDNLVVWRSEAGPPDSDLRLTWGSDHRRIFLRWDELRRPKHSPNLEPRSGQGSGLQTPPASSRFALPILTRIIDLHGGHMEESGLDPWRLCISWPFDPTY